MITGEPGVGKSRLAVEVVRRHPDFAVQFGRCQPFDRLTAYSVTEAIIRPLLGIELDSPPADAGAALLAWLADRSPGPSRWPRCWPSPSAPTSRRREKPTPWSPPSAGCGHCNCSPNWSAAPSSHRPRSSSTTSITPTTRRGAHRRAGHHRRRRAVAGRHHVGPEETLPGTRIALEHLDPPAVVAMVDTLLGDRAIAPSTVRSIVQRAAGNPLFVGELLRCLAEDPDAEVPSSLEALVEVPHRHARARRSVVAAERVGARLGGRHHPARADERRCPDPASGSLGSPRPVPRTGRARRRALPLRHLPPCRVRRLSYRTRRNLHRRVIDVLERSARSDNIEDLARLAFHAHHSGDRERTWGYGTAAAAAAAGAAMFGEAARLYGAHPPGPSRRIAGRAAPGRRGGGRRVRGGRPTG